MGHGDEVAKQVALRAVNTAAFTGETRCQVGMTGMLVIMRVIW